MLEQELENFNALFLQWIRGYYAQDQQLGQACRYALEGPGKRVRPLLLLLSHRLFSERWHDAIPAAVCVEMIHTYSLVHDDLPIIDNDDFRRGRHTVHKVFDEATALLVGDALLSDAFSCLTGAFERVVPQIITQLRPTQKLAMVQELSRAIGSQGMVLGQSCDLVWAHRSGYALEDLVNIHSRKTGALFAASCAIGAIAGDSSEDELARLRKLGEHLGLAYQIMDDLIDDLQGTGKSAGKDRSAGKLTYLSLMSREAANSKVEALLAEVQAILDSFGSRSQNFMAWLTQLAQRKF